MVKWLSIKEVARQSGKAERTLRLYASQGKIKAKKEGKEWLCDVSSLKNAGIILTESAVKSPAMPNITAKPAATAKPSGKFAANSSSPKNKEKSERKYKMLNDLGVYRDLIELWSSDSFKNMDDVAAWLKYSAEQVAIGFYEFHADRKVHYFRNAREGIVKAIVGINLNREHKGQSLMGTLENEIVPGLIGLIKRYEKLKR